MTKETVEGPHVKRLGWLKNGNPPGDPSDAKREMSAARRPKHQASHRGGIGALPHSQLEAGHYLAEARANRRRVRELLSDFAKLVKAIQTGEFPTDSGSGQ